VPTRQALQGNDADAPVLVLQLALASRFHSEDAAKSKRVQRCRCALWLLLTRVKGADQHSGTEKQGRQASSIQQEKQMSGSLLRGGGGQDVADFAVRTSTGQETLAHDDHRS
jgi:hypothetical protein